MKRLMRYLLPLGSIMVLLAIAAGPAAAQKVANPGTFNFKLTNGVMKVKDQEFGFDESQNINFNGTVDRAGAISIPTINFPSYPLSVSGFNLTVKINVVGPTTGTINPLNGAVSLRLRVWIKIDGVPLGGDCRIASSSSPIDLNTLVTGTNGSKTGTPYNITNGTMKIVNGSFAVPASSSCGIAAGTVDSTVGLPSSSGNNTAEFNIRTGTTVNRAINPVLNATPTTGTAPFTTTLSAAGSTVSAGPATYRWDFTNNGSIDQTTSTPTTTHTYTAGGSQTARVQVVDSEGDTADATRALTVNAYPDLGISASHAGDFRVGTPGTYRISLENSGYAATTGPVTVTSTLPAGLTYQSVSGTGWSCSATGQELTCSRSAAIGVGASAPDLDVTVGVGPDAFDAVEPVFTVAATGDNGPDDNTASDPTVVRATDLRLTLSHPSHAMLPGPDPANLIILEVENVGDAGTSGNTVVTDELPDGLTPVSAGGEGWTCEITGQLVTCTHVGTIVAGASASPVTVAVNASLEPGSLGTTVLNQASVSTEFDLDAANDTASDPTLILDGHDIGITKSHEGNLTAGGPGTYTLSTENFGTADTTGPTTVTDELPSGLSFISADGGPQWECSAEETTVTCVHAAVIPAGETAPEITLTVGVGVEAIPGIDNTATVETPDDPNPANDSSTDPAVVQAIDLVVTKTHQGTLRVGAQGIYTLAVTNNGDSTTIDKSTVVDELPPGLEFVSVDGGPAWECTETAGTVTCDHAGLLAAGESAPDITLTVDVGIAAAPEVTNTVSVATQNDFNPGNNDASDTGTVIDIDNAVDISRTGTFRPGKTGTYLLSVENIGAVSTTAETVVTPELPESLDPVSVTGDGWTCETVPEVTCSYPAGLGAGASAPAISLRVMVTTAAIPQVTTTVETSTEGDRFPANDSATDTAVVLGPDLAASSGHDGTFQVGKPHEYVLGVENLGSDTSEGAIALTDQLPAGFSAGAVYGNGWSCSVTGQTVTCLNPVALAAGQSLPPVTVEVTPTAAALPSGETAATVENNVSVSNGVDSNPANDTAVDATDLVAVDLALEMDGADSVSVGEVAEYRLAATNTGDATAEAPFRITHTMPVGFSGRPSGGDDWVCSTAGRKVNCTYGQNLPAGESAADLTVRTLVGRSAASWVESVATVSAADDVIATNDTVSLANEVDAAPDLEVAIQALGQSGSEFRVGSDSGYLLTVSNRGTAPTTETVRAEVRLPAGMNFLGLDSGQGWTCPATASSVVACEFEGSIQPDDVSLLSLLVGVGPAAGKSVSTEAKVAVDGDLNPENDTAVRLSEIVRTDLELARSHRPVWKTDGIGNYGLRVTNVGSAPTTGPVTVTEVLPFGTTLSGAAGEGWNCSVSGRRMTCVNPAVITPGASSDLEVELQLSSATGSQITATSTVRTVDDVDPSNDTATEDITVESSLPPDVHGKVRITTSRVKATRSGVVTVWVSCPASATVKCRGVLKLKSRGKVRMGNGKRVRLNLGQARYATAPGRKAPVRFTLKKTARKALAGNRKIRSKATATNSGGIKASSRSILVRAGK